MGALLQTLEIIFEVQRKRINEKITRKKKLPNIQNMFFFLFFSSLDPSYLRISQLFYFLFILNGFKMLYKHHLKFYKSSLYFNSNKTTYKKFFGCLGTSLRNIWWFVFLNYWPPLLWGAIIFSIIFHFWPYVIYQTC